jgi:hydrogenase 3 maturation protease
MCVGNKKAGDDGVGSFIATSLKKMKNINYLDCGIIPENYTSLVKKYNPNKLVIIDAADMNLKPGEFRIISKEKIGLMHISTHNIPLSILINYLEKYIKKIYFIGIQPKKFAGNISNEVKQSAKNLINIIQKDEIEKIKIFQ